MLSHNEQLEWPVPALIAALDPLRRHLEGAPRQFRQQPRIETRVRACPRSVPEVVRGQGSPVHLTEAAVQAYGWRAQRHDWLRRQFHSIQPKRLEARTKSFHTPICVWRVSSASTHGAFVEVENSCPHNCCLTRSDFRTDMRARTSQSMGLPARSHCAMIARRSPSKNPESGKTFGATRVLASRGCRDNPQSCSVPRYVIIWTGLPA
jgi:hypothetical protein